MPAFVFLFTQEPAEAEGTAEVPHDGQAFPGNGKVEWQVVLYIVPEVFPSFGVSVFLCRRGKNT